MAVFIELLLIGVGLSMDAFAVSICKGLAMRRVNKKQAFVIGLFFGGFQALSWLVFLFGVVNLINTTLSNQMSRKRENSVFRAIGLTRKQLCQMTIYEGICYAFSAALATLAVGLPIAVLAARKFSEMTFHGVIMPYSFPFLQMGLFVLVLFGLEVILSFWTMRRQKNQSLVEEMRAME